LILDTERLQDFYKTGKYLYIPDQRPTMFWSPNLDMEGTKSIVEFYTSDMPGRYWIIVEGISQKGTICYGTAPIDVISSDGKK